MATLVEAASNIQQFEKGSLTHRISSIESTLQSTDRTACKSLYPSLGITFSLLDSAYALKRTASQINVLIHAVGILVSLPHVLREGEVIEALSLGAGNTGRPFDLETTFRIAEFKFISWKGGPESIRQNSLFKDFYLLAEYDTVKERYLYVIGTEHPLRFLQSGRALKSVMSRNNKLWADFQKRYGERFSEVHEYYKHRRSRVQLVDITKIIPQLATALELDNGQDAVE